jgi:hypothetical protein
MTEADGKDLIADKINDLMNAVKEVKGRPIAEELWQEKLYDIFIDLLQVVHLQIDLMDIYED